MRRAIPLTGCQKFAAKHITALHTLRESRPLCFGGSAEQLPLFSFINRTPTSLFNISNGPISRCLCSPTMGQDRYSFLSEQTLPHPQSGDRLPITWLITLATLLSTLLLLLVSWTFINDSALSLLNFTIQKLASCISLLPELLAMAKHRTYAASQACQPRKLFSRSQRNHKFLNNEISQPQSLTGRPSGMKNMTNACFLNSVLQALSSLEPLLRHTRAVDEAHSFSSDGSTSNALTHIITALNSADQRHRTLSAPPVLRMMSTWSQEDAQEYYSKLMESLEDEAKRAMKALPADENADDMAAGGDTEHNGNTLSQGTPEKAQAEVTPHTKVPSQTNLNHEKNENIPKPSNQLSLKSATEGSTAKRTACTVCGHSEGLRLEPFQCLTLTDFGRSIGEGLSNLTSVETIAGVDCNRCTMEAYRIKLQTFVGRPPTPESEGDHKARDDGSSKVIKPRNQSLIDRQQQAAQRLSLIEEAIDDADFADETLKKCQIPSKMFQKTKKTLQVVLAKPPQCLVIHLNRSRFNGRGMTKSTAMCAYEETLELDPWVLPWIRDGGDENDMRFAQDPTISLLGESRTSSKRGLQEPSCVYKLKAVVAHAGTHNYGHYVCYRQSLYCPKSSAASTLSKAEMKQWWRISDETVSAAKTNEVLSQRGAFMLFYELQPVPKHLRRHPECPEASAPPVSLATPPATPQPTPPPTEPDLEQAGEEAVAEAVSAAEASKAEASITPPLPVAEPMVGKEDTPTKKRRETRLHLVKHKRRQLAARQNGLPSGKLLSDRRVPAPKDFRTTLRMMQQQRQRGNRGSHDEQTRCRWLNRTGQTHRRRIPSALPRLSNQLLPTSA